MRDPASERVASGQAWDDFCEVIRLGGHAIDRWGDIPSDLDRAEWYRFTARLLRNGLERYLENCEPERPRLRDAPWRQSINFQSPDQDHLLAEFVDGSHDYRITGNRGTIPYFVMASWRASQPPDLGARDWAPKGYDGLKEFDPTRLNTTGFLQSDAIEFDAGGNFEVIVSQRKHEKNWLPITQDCVGLLVRNVYHERAKEIPPTMRIERLDNPQPRPVRLDEVGAGLAKTAQFLLGYSELVREWWFDNLSKRPNRIRFSMATYLSNGGVPDRHHGFGTWQVPEDRALVIEFVPPDCEYWILQLCNLWQENFDNYEDGQGHVTKFTARYEADGKVRIVIAARDPGFGNWIDPFGHRAGQMSLRLIKTKGPPPPVTIYDLPLDQLQRDGAACLTPEAGIASGDLAE